MTLPVRSSTLRNRILLGFVFGFCAVLILIYEDEHEVIFHNTWKPKENNQNNKTISKKWIVITTILSTTELITKLSDLPEWQVVIVARSKTPGNWSCNNFIVLTIEMQQELNYNILPLLPLNSYSRKMIGYLYAIQHGAEYIYDTEDDLSINLNLDWFDYDNITSGLVYTHRNESGKNVNFVNVYAHFGRPDVWPRGYPLEMIKENFEENYQVCSKIKTPVIQQGLVNQDPDVDAMFELLHEKNEKKGMNVQFDDFAPPIILPKNTYCPFNSQNTMFHYDAFWALILPVTATLRVTDIWRSYWAQRLLHITGNQVAFYGPNSYRKPNNKNHMKDYTEENKLYTVTLNLVNSLQEWRCGSDSLKKCMIDLGEHMFQKNFWAKDDVRLIKAWVEDLDAIGYTFPMVDENQNWLSSNRDCHDAAYVSNFDKKNHFNMVLMENVMKFNKLCNSVMADKFFLNEDVEMFNHTKNVILVVTINRNDYAAIPFLKSLYDLWFANVIFCSAFPQNWQETAYKQEPFNTVWPVKERFSFINLSKDEMHDGYFGYICLKMIADMKINANVDGYFVIADDMLFNFWNTLKDYDKINYAFSCPDPKVMVWWNMEWAEKNLKKLASFLNTTTTLDCTYEPLSQLKKTVLASAWCHSDIYYVPQHLVKPYSILSQQFFEFQIFLEIAVPKILYILGFGNSVRSVSDLHSFKDDGTVIRGKYLWGERRRFDDFYDKNDIFLHAVKFSHFKNADFTRKICKGFLTSMVSAINRNRTPHSKN